MRVAATAQANAPPDLTGKESHPMGRWTYYSPLLLGFVVALLAEDLYEPILPPTPAWQHWLGAALLSLACGVYLQLALIGSQGAFAQVLPLPGGRSVRGAGAVGGGWLLLAALALTFVCGLLLWESVQPAATIAGAAAGVAGAVVILIYVWCWPTAQRDFATSLPRPGRD